MHRQGAFRLGHSIIAGLLVVCAIAQWSDTSSFRSEPWKPLQVDRLEPLLDLSRAQAHKLREIDHHYIDAERILQEGADRIPPNELREKHRTLVLRGIEEVRAVLDSTQFDRWWIVHQQQAPRRGSLR